MNRPVTMADEPQSRLTTATPAEGAESSTPPDVPSPPVPLSVEINAATQKQHTALNRMISDLLPRALPPHADNAWTLAHGLVPFAQIFVSFERAWTQLPEAAHGFRANPHHRYDLLNRLHTLRPDGLARSERFRDDLGRTSGISQTALPRSDVDRPSPGVDREKLVAKPHLLLAYAWVMYMAVFSGGRWIRSQLSTKITHDFWSGVQHEQGEDKKRQICGISFLSFPEGTRDGEDIKREFKERLAATELILTEQERREVVAEAVYLFTYCITTVQRVEEAQARRADALAGHGAAIAVVIAFAFDVYSYISLFLCRGLLWIRYGKSPAGERQHIDRTATRYHRYL